MGIIKYLKTKKKGFARLNLAMRGQKDASDCEVNRKLRRLRNACVL